MRKKELEENLRGFTIVEILVIVALVAILAVITFIAIDPTSDYKDRRNNQRSSDVLQILTAIDHYNMTNGTPISEVENIPTCPVIASIGTGGVDLADELVDKYIIEIPTDPNTGTEENTGYAICKTRDGKFEVAAPNAEGKNIVLKR